MTNKQREFIKQLRDLLLKYHADIGWTCDDCSDTYGLYNDHLYITMYGQKDIEFETNGIDIFDLNYLLKESEENDK